MAGLEIERLHFTNPSMRTFNLEITAIIDPDADIGWFSHITVSLFYHRRLIGRKALRNKYIIPDGTNNAYIKLEGFKIRNMTGFKAFIQRLMPKIGVICQKEGQTSITAVMDNDENGHELSIAIDLNDIFGVSILDANFQLDGKKITLKFTLSSSEVVDLPFGYCEFSLKQNETFSVSLYGEFDILADGCEITLVGNTEATGLKLSGTADLRGVKAFDHVDNWLAHAIRMFELEVGLV